MHVVGHGAAVQPLLGAARALGAFRVQQYQDLGGLGKRGAAQQAVFFNRVDGGLGLRVGQQQQLVAVAAHAARPGRGLRVCQQQHEVIARLDLVEQHGDAPVGRGVGTFTLGNAGLVQFGIHGGRVHHPHAAHRAEVARQALAKGLQVHAAAHGQQAHGHRALLRGRVGGGA